MANGKRSFYPIPNDIHPLGKMCLNIQIPDNEDYLSAFIGAFSELTNWFSHERDENRSAKEVADVWKEVFDDFIATLDTNQCDNKGFPMLRQNPDEPCKMQYQDTFGDWVTFYDFGACDLFGTNLEINALLNYSETNIAGDAIGTQVNIYNNDPNAYPPQTAVNQVQIDNRNTLLCYAMRVLVSTMLETIARNKDEAERNAITLSMVVGAVLALGFAPLTPIVIGGILAGFGLGYVVAVQTISSPELRDQSAIDEVLCHLYLQLSGDNLSRAGLQTSLTPNPFSVGSNAYKMTEVLKPMFDVLGAYLAIVTHMQLNIASVSALVNECLNCGNDAEWEYTFDFTLANHTAWWIPYNMNVSQMTWELGVGWKQGVNIPVSNSRYNVLYLRSVTMPQNTFIHGYDLYYQYTQATIGDNNETRIQYAYVLDGVQSAFTETDIPATSHTAVVYKSIERMADRLFYQIVGGRRVGATPNSTITLTKIVITGRGYNPFI